MHFALKGAAMVAILVGAASVDARAQSAVVADGLIVIESAKTIADTERQLAAAIEAEGLKIAARVDHAANAKSVSLELSPTGLYVFGNPRAGTLLMDKQRTAAIDLPLKVLIWEDAGKVKIAYNDPAWIARRHGIDPALPVLGTITKTIQGFAAAAAQ